ncbi:MAG: transcription termination/antitermination NusG family protein [Acidobacteriota bacterium]
MSPNTPSTPPWFALLTHPKHEQTAARGLRQQGFEAYLPIHNVRRRWSDRMKVVHTVLFPGYVFCRLEAADKLRALTSPSIRGIVSVGRDPVLVADSDRGDPGDHCARAACRPVPVFARGRIGAYYKWSFASVRGRNCTRAETTGAWW